MAQVLLLLGIMEHRNGRARSPMESMRRRQLEARRLSDSSPIAGLGTYQMMRPARGREVIAPRKRVPHRPRVPNGSDAFGVVASNRHIEEVPLPPLRSRPQPPSDPRADDHTPILAQRLYRAEIAPPPPLERATTGWLLPMSLAAVVSSVIIALTLWLR